MCVERKQKPLSCWFSVCVLSPKAPLYPTTSANTPTDKALHWRHNERNGDPKHRHLDGLLNILFRRISKKTSMLRVNGLCEGNPRRPVNSLRKGPVKRKLFPFDDVIVGVTNIVAKTHVIDIPFMWNIRRSIYIAHAFLFSCHVAPFHTTPPISYKISYIHKSNEFIRGQHKQTTTKENKLVCIFQRISALFSNIAIEVGILQRYNASCWHDSL